MKGSVSLKDNDVKIGLEIKIISNLIYRKLDKNLSSSGISKITTSHAYIIGFLYENQDKIIYQKDIEKELQIRRSTATGILKLMEKNGLIEKRADEKDARLKKIILTKKSINYHKLVENTMQELESKMVNGITKEELKVVLMVSNKIKKNIS